MKKIHSGFTLIELMIVVAIIGILASIAIPNFTTFQCKAKQTEAMALLHGILITENSYKQETEVYLCKEEDLGPLGGLEYTNTSYSVVEVTCSDPETSYDAQIKSLFGGPGGTDIWQMTQEGVLVHLQNGCASH